MSQAFAQVRELGGLRRALSGRNWTYIPDIVIGSHWVPVPERDGCPAGHGMLAWSHTIGGLGVLSGTTHRWARAT
eukprot:scaffold10623_cov139-Isochrysis_galbana.AAC.6